MIELLKQKYRTKHYQKNQLIHKENDICRDIGFVVKGEVIIKSYDYNGKEIVFNTIKEDEIFGNSLIFSNNKKYLGNVIANKDSEIIFINKNDLINLLKNNNDFLNGYMEKVANETKNLHSNIRLLSIDSAKDRLLHYLIINNKEIEYDTITSLANKLNLKRETLSRTISLLTKQKVIIKKENKLKML